MDTIFIILLTILGTIAAIFILGILVRSMRLSRGRRMRDFGRRPDMQNGMMNRRIMALPLNHEYQIESNLLE